MRVLTLCAAATLALALAVPARAADPAATMYRSALARERAVRARLNSAAGHSAATLNAIRAVVLDYERLVLRYPRSGYCDNALWRGAQLASDAFTFFGQPRDRRTAVHLIHWLHTQYPYSPYAHRAPGAAPPPRITAPRTARAAPPVRRPPPRAPAPPRAAPAPQAGARDVTRASDDRDATLRGITRSVFPGRVRVSIELDREALYEEQRASDPSRLIFDFETTRPLPDLTHARFTYRHADAVRDVHVTGTDDNRTRVTIDLTGVTSYATFALYNPYRLVIDCRTSPPHPAPAAPPEANAAPPPVPLEASAIVDSAVRSLPTVRSDRPPAARPMPAAVPRRPPVAQAVAEAAPSRPAIELYPVPGRRRPPPAPPRASSPAAGDSHGPYAADQAAPAPDAAPTTAAGGADPPSFSPRLPATNLDGGFSMARQLGLGISRIVIDPGHGGRDPGAEANGVTEADLVLDIALRLRALLERHGGFQVILTRDTNVFVPLWKRTEIANQADADLFLSIHANASPNHQARGIETYFLNFASNPEEAAVAARENATSGQTMGDLSDLVKTIAMNSKLDESRDFATMVQRAMYSTLRAQDPDTRNLGVKQAPFAVLIGASMPSVLAEVSFVTNRQDAHYLKEGSYRERIADALYKGILRYQHALKNVRTADNQ